MSLAKKSWKKAIALFLAVVMALSFTPSITSFADDFDAEVLVIQGSTEEEQLTFTGKDSEDVTSGWRTSDFVGNASAPVGVSLVGSDELTNEDGEFDLVVTADSTATAGDNYYLLLSCDGVYKKVKITVVEAPEPDDTVTVTIGGAQVSKEVVFGGTYGTQAVGSSWKKADFETNATAAPTGVNVAVDGGQTDEAGIATLNVTAGDTATAGDYYLLLSCGVNKKIKITVEEQAEPAGPVEPTNIAKTALLITMDNSTTQAAENKADPNTQNSNEPASTIGSYVYTGQLITPVVTIGELTGEDFDLAGDTSAVDVGTYTLKIIGKGDYTGTASVYWEIKGTTDSTKRPVTITNKDALNRVYEYNKAVNAVAAVSPELSAGKAITYEYFNAADVTGITEETDAAEDVTTDYNTAMEANNGALKAKKLASAPVNAGDYVVFAVVPADGNFDKTVWGLKFTIDQKKLYIVPDADQKKTFGDKDKTITFKAYEYYNEGGEHLWREYLPKATDLVKSENAKYAYDAAAGTVNVDGQTVKLADKRPNVEYDVAKIDQSKAPFLTRARGAEDDEGTEEVDEKKEGTADNLYGEVKGTYDILLNDAKDADTDAYLIDTNYKAIVDTVRDTTGTEAQNIATVAGLVTSSKNANSKLGNDVYTIEQRSLTGATATFYNADTNKWVADLTYPNNPNEVVTREPDFRIVDTLNIWNPETKTYKEKNDVILYITDTDLVAEGQTNYTVTYPMVTVSGDVKNNAGENHNIQLSAITGGNYKDSQTITWHIAPSGNRALIGVYDADNLPDDNKGYLDINNVENSNAEINTLDIADDGVLEIVYDGKPHTINVAVKAVKVDNTYYEYGDFAESADPTYGDVATIRYKNTNAKFDAVKVEKVDPDLTDVDTTKVDMVTGTSPVEPSTKWENDAPTFTDVGTYKVLYSVESRDGVFKSEEHEFIVEIKPLDVIVTKGNETGETYHSAETTGDATKVEVQDKDEYALNLAPWMVDELTVYNENGHFDITYDTDWTVAGKSTIQIGFKEYDEAGFTAEWIARYNNLVKLGVLSDYNANYYEENKGLDVYNAIETFDELPAEVKTEAEKSFFENLTGEAKVAAEAGLNAALDKYKGFCLFNKNFNAVETKNGTLTLNIGALNLEVVVGDRQDEKTGAATAYNWIYGGYDSANSLIKLRENDGHKDTLGDKLSAGLEDKAVYTVYTSTNGSTGISQVAASEIDDALSGLAPGTYILEARINPITGSTTGDVATTSDQEDANYKTFTVKEGVLTVLTGETELIGGTTSAGKAPTKLEKIEVQEKDSKVGVAAGENTYKLQYKNADYLEQDWQDNLADLKANATTSAWASKGEVTVRVRVVPQRNGAKATAETAYYSWDQNPGFNNENAYVETKIKVTAREAGKNDKVENLSIVYLAEDAGKKASAGAWLGTNDEAGKKLITKTYGKYTSNKRNAIGKIEYAEDGNYIPVSNDNEIELRSLVDYVATELLYNNGFAVGEQNTYGKYANQKFAPYMDAQYFTWDVVKSSDGISPDEVYVDNTNNNKDDGDWYYVPMESLSDNPAPTSTSGDYVAYIYDNTQSFGAYRSADALALIDGISFSIKEVNNDDGVLATRTVDGKAEPIVSIGNGGATLNYTLAKTLPASGTASILLSVSRADIADIEFYVNIMVDGAGPDIGVFNTDLGKDTSTKIQKNLAFTDTYLKNSPEFTITTNDVEGGVYYTFATDTRTFASVDDLEASFKAAKNDKFDESKLWYALEGTTIQTPEKDGGYILYVRGEDAAGNVTYASSLTGFTVDSVGPVIAKASDTSEKYGSEAKTYLVKEGATAALTVIDDTEVVVTAAAGEAEAKTLTPNPATLNYTLAASADTYSVKAVDKAGNETVALIDVNYEVPNVGNKISIVYSGQDIDLATVVDKTDAEKKLYEKSENSGDITLADGTNKLEDDEKTYVWQDVAGVRGVGTVEGTILKPTQAGTFVIEVKSAKNGIWGETVIPAYITVEKGTREVGVELVDAAGAAKTEFTKTEATNMADFIKLAFSIESAAPEAQYIKYNYYNKTTGAKLEAAPVAVGDYEVSVNLETDGLWNAAASEDATVETLNKKAAYSIVEYNKVTVNNDDTKGTVTVNDGTKDLTTEDLAKVADRTKLTIKAEAKEGFAFSKWIVSGIELSDADAAKDTIEVAEVAGDISVEAVYVAKIVITKQPVDAKVYADEKAEFSVVATGNGDDDLTYQWMVKGAEEAAFHIVAGATAATYTIEKADTAVNGNSYKVVITSKSTAEVKESDVAKLEIIGNSIEDAVVTFANDKTEYTGKEIAPNITKVTVNGTDLSASRDYDVAYDKILNAGEYTIKLTGKGDWSGEATATFTVVAKPVTAEMFTIEDVQYTGKAIEAEVVTDLVKDTDFTVAYKNNTEVGTATATITGKGNYTGSVDVKFAVLGESIAKATVTGISTAAYTGKAITPTPVVKLNGKTLKKGTDYTVSYKNNTKVGTATVTITGKGDYSGKITKKFLIKQISFKYRAYVQKKNWMAWSTAKVSGTSASKMAGTTDNLRMETIQMQLSGVSGQVKYRAYVEKMGWTQWATTADTTTFAGTKGLSRRVEMIQLQASGQVATLYDMYYRTYCEKFGWLGWVKSGEKSGSAGYARKLEAFQINFVRKGESFTVKSDTTKGFYDSAKDGKNPK